MFAVSRVSDTHGESSMEPLQILGHAFLFSLEMLLHPVHASIQLLEVQFLLTNLSLGKSKEKV